MSQELDDAKHAVEQCLRMASEFQGVDWGSKAVAALLTVVELQQVQINELSYQCRGLPTHTVSFRTKE